MKIYPQFIICFDFALCPFDCVLVFFSLASPISSELENIRPEKKIEYLKSGKTIKVKEQD